MFRKISDGPARFELALLLVIVGMSCLLYRLDGYMMVVLNLFFLPVVLGGFYLGRYRAGVLALFCMISASCVTALNLTGFAAISSPMTIGLAVLVWGAVLGLTALLVGTLSDERAARIKELHEAYVGVVEVLSTYLQSGNRRVKARSVRVAELSQAVAEELNLSPRQIDDIRVAALLQDVGNLEITAKIMKRALDNLDLERGGPSQTTFQGLDLVHSLSGVLRGAMPLLLDGDDPEALDSNDAVRGAGDLPVGAQIIRVTRAYDVLTGGGRGAEDASTAHRQAIDELRRDKPAGVDEFVLNALNRAQSRLGTATQAAATLELAAAGSEAW